MSDLLDKLKFWLDSPSHLSTEHAYFHQKVMPLIPEIVETIATQQSTIVSLQQSLRAKEVEVENLRARMDMCSSENRHMRDRLDEQQPEIARLQKMIFNAQTALRNGVF